MSHLLPVVRVGLVMASLADVGRELLRVVRVSGGVIIFNMILGLVVVFNQGHYNLFYK